MKKLLTILLFTLASSLGHSQYVVNVSGSGPGGNSDSALFANRADSLGITPASVIISNIASKYNLSDTAAAMDLYKAKIIELTDSSISKTAQVNGLASTSATHTSNIALKYNLADTAAAMNAYRLKIIELTDSSISKTAQVNGLASTSGTHTTNIATNTSDILLKVNISDTATAMAGYKAKIIELTDSSVSKTAQVNGLATTSGTHTTNIATNTSDILLKINISDSAAMLLPYRNKINLNTDSITSIHNQIVGLASTSATHTTNTAAAYTTKTIGADSSYYLTKNASGSKTDTTKYGPPGSSINILTGLNGDGYTIGTGMAQLVLHNINYNVGRRPDAIATYNAKGQVTQVDSMWQNITATTKTMVAGEGYVSTSTANAQIVYTLPAIAYVGQTFSVTGGSGTGGWRVGQNASQVIKYNTTSANATTTTGTGGYIQSGNQYDAVEIICIVANTTFLIKSSQGALTVN